MDRREWLTLIYREANIFVRDHKKLIADVTSENRDIDSLQPALWKQLRHSLTDAESLNDFIKFSLLKNPDPELWREETKWDGVLVGVSLACLTYDVLGLVAKIIDGELPETNPDTIMDYNPHAGIALESDMNANVTRLAAEEDDDSVPPEGNNEKACGCGKNCGCGDGEDGDADEDDIEAKLAVGYSEIFGEDDDEPSDDEEDNI